MMTSWIAGLLFTAVLLIVCWMLAEFWLGKRQEMTGEAERLRFGSRTAFALTHFWKRVDEGKEIPHNALKTEMASVKMPGEREDGKGQERQADGKIHTEAERVGRKRYKIKENM